MTNLTLLCEEKKEKGSGVSRALRREGKIPAIVYGFEENYMISVNYKDFLKEYYKGNLLSKLFDIKVKDQVFKVIPREIHVDPVTDDPIHIDFQLVKSDIPIRVAVRVKVINQDQSPGIKKGGVLNIVKKYVSLNCVPRNVPQYLEIDISGFEIGRNVHINDIKLPEGVTPTQQDNFTILTVSGRVEEKEEAKQEPEKVVDVEKKE